MSEGRRFMQMHGNTIFITGGTSGIGQGLAEAFHQRGNQVIITGRREARLKEICQRHPGMRYFVLDVTCLEAIQAVARKAIEKFPAVNCVFHNAGVQMRFDF
ncbi:MAG: SDR family NAD(P)-dependent oxidoreductase, partial [Terriglobia bacterium]